MTRPQVRSTTKAKARIVEQIDTLKNDHTIIVVAHRLSTIVGADKIIMIEDGKVIAEGEHKMLIKTCPPYRKLYQSEEQEI